MNALRYNEFGDAEQVLTLVDEPEPGAPGAGEVLVDVLYSPLNHHDLGRIAGRVVPPPLPAVAGNEGVARVVATGAGVTDIGPGDIVVLPLLLGTWRERLIAPAAGLAPLPSGDRQDLQQYSMLGSNTPTAALALSEYEKLDHGDWVVQNSGNGGVGRNVIALARHRGLRTASVVRRPELVDELRAAGADVVVLDGPDLSARIAAAIGHEPVRLAIDGVGGATARELVALLADGGTLVRYSARDEIDPDGAGAARGVTSDFLFVGAYDYPTRIAPIIAESVPLVRSGALHVPIEAVYERADFRAAITHLQRGGKILFHIQD